LTLIIFRIVIFLSIFFPVAAGAQLQLNSQQIVGLASIDPIKESRPSISDPLEINNKLELNEGNLSSPAQSPKSISILYSTTNKIPAYQPRHYGVFCRIESRIEKKSIISPRFRLGSSAYVDMLEGKGN